MRLLAVHSIGIRIFNKGEGGGDKQRDWEKNHKIFFLNRDLKIFYKNI